MTSVFANVFRLTGGESVWANVFVLDETVTDPSHAGWIAKAADRLFLTSSQQRVSVCSPNQRVWIAREGNE